MENTGKHSWAIRKATFLCQRKASQLSRVRQCNSTPEKDLKNSGITK